MTITITHGDSSTSSRATPEQTLLDAVHASGWHINAPCGGDGRCGKCIVRVSPPDGATPLDEAEKRFVAEESGERLACRARPTTDLTVVLPEDARAPDREDAIAKGGAIHVESSNDPAVLVERIDLPEPTIEDQRSVLARLRDASSLSWLTVTPTQLTLASAALQGGERIRLVTDARTHRTISLERDAESADQEVFGVAFDIGTTTVAGYLVDLGRHALHGTRSEANAQAPYGADVISRISHAETGAPLTEAIRAQLASMTSALIDGEGSPENIVSVAVAGNTTMLHLLMDVPTETIARAPFAPLFTEALSVRPEELGLPVHQDASVLLLPGVAAYVGADIVADLLACGMHRTRGISLLVDIGTNGEIVCGGADGLLACSTAAGPAFEGASIRYGSGGLPGAINHVERDGSRILTETIGDVAARSICGTGLMDSLAMLLEDGIVDAMGRMESDLASLEPGSDAATAYEGRLIEVDGEPALRLDGEVILTQGDVRQVQLAKGAIAAGVRVMLEEAGIDAAELESVFLAGGFGTYVRPESAIRVGLLPPIDPERVVAIGNAAGAGAARALVDRVADGEAEEIIRACRYTELSGSVSFQNHYMEEMLFPES